MALRIPRYNPPAPAFPDRAFIPQIFRSKPAQHQPACQRVADLIFRRATQADVPAIVRLLADDMLGASRETTDAESRQQYLNAFRAVDADASSCWSWKTEPRSSARCN
jgi:hypothetical protein